MLRFWPLAFLIPLAIRAVPEIIVGPYPVGFDTIAFYVPNTIDWAAGKASVLGMLRTAPLIYWISVPAYLLSRVNPVWIFKFLGPLLYGCLSLAFFRFLRLAITWSEKRALGGTLFASLYFVTLRIGWDLYRNMLGLTFILLSLPLLQDLKGLKSELALSVLLLLAVMSDQLTGVLALVLIGVRVVWSIWNKNGRAFQLVRVGIPALTLFGVIVYSGTAQGVELVAGQPTVPGSEAVVSSVGFLGYAFLPLLPLAMIGFRRLRNFETKTWVLFCVLMVLVALLPFYGLSVASYRWALLLDIPLCIYAATGLARLWEIVGSISSLSSRLLGRGLPIVPLLLLISAVLYVALPAQNAVLYYTAFPGSVPTSMIQSSVPMSDMGSLRGILNWVQTQMSPQDVLITHQAIYGWARAYLPPTEHIINYGDSSPLEGVSIARSDGYSSVWLVWWITGLGWYGQPSAPSSFTMIFREGNIAVYKYQ